jgi:hypothetical protein
MGIHRLARSRLFRPVLLLFSLAFFELVLLAGFYGSPVGNRNAAVILVWVLWFFILTVLLIPLGARVWCMLCPIPVPAEWLSRLSMVRKSERVVNLGLRWPRSLDNLWLQNFSFLAVAALSPLILTRPSATAAVLLLFVFAALVLDLSFKNRRAGKIFCRYACPIGGFVGVYSNLSFLSIRPRDRRICKRCKPKTCIRGNEEGYACPWLIYPGGMEKNSHCGFCLECIKSCAYGNMVIKGKGFTEGLLKNRRLDEAFKGFVLLGSVLVYSAFYFGWWGELKEVINLSESIFLSADLNWLNLLLFGSALGAVSLFLLPWMQALSAYLAKRAASSGASLEELFIGYSYSLIPLGFAAWAGFVVSMLMGNGSYVISVVSDPLGWGWNLFGTSDYAWRPYLPELTPYVLLAIFLAGSVLAMQIGWRISHEYFKERALKAALPQAFFIGLLTFVLVYLLAMP